MSTAFEHPSLQMPVTDDQRERAERWLQDAYAQGRVSELEFDTRIGQVLSAGTRRELNAAFYGLVAVSPPSQALGAHPAYAPLVRPETRDRTARGAAGLAHFSALVSFGLVGPLVFFAAATPGTVVRREAAKAFNFQLSSLLVLIAVGIVGGVLDLEFLFPVWALTWLVLTVVGGAKALQGDNWRNPVGKVVPLKVLDER